MKAKTPDSRPADAAALARDLVDRLAAISASLSQGPVPAAVRGAAASVPGAPPPLADFRSPRAVLENGAGYVSPFLPPEASLRPLKALLLRVLRIVTRDQTVFNSAVLEAIRGALLVADGAFRETGAAIERARTGAADAAEAAEAARREAGGALARAEAAEQAGRDSERRVLDALEKSRITLEEALQAAREESKRSLDAQHLSLEELATRLGRLDEAQQTESRRLEESRTELRSTLERLRRVETGTAASLAHFKNRADGIAADLKETQLRVEAVERSREALAADVVSTQSRVDGLETDRDRLAAEQAEGSRSFAEIAADLLKTEVRVDGLERDRDLLLSAASSANVRFENLEKDGDRLASAQAEGSRASAEIAADLLKTEVRVDGLEKDRDRLSDESAASGRTAEEISSELLKTEVRVDGLEKNRDLLLSEAASTSAGLELLGKDRDRLAEISASGAKAASEIAADLFRTQVRVDGMEKDRDRLSEASAAGVRTAEELRASLAALEARLAGEAEDLRHLKLEWSTLRSEIGSLSGRPVKKGAAPARPPDAPAASDPIRAGIYVDFEEGFRGSEEEIRKRQEKDVALFRKAPGPVADLGCGRGEFLEALKAARIPGVGCDANPVMAARAKKKGLKVDRADLFEWLGARRKDSLGGIAAFQVVEHLPPARLYDLVELAAAKLAPGGIVLIETVNPESAYAMKWFWMDLTHVRPVPAPSLARLLSASGFRDVRIDWRSPVPDSEAPPAELRSDEKLGPMMRLLFGPQDYAVIGRK